MSGIFLITNDNTKAKQDSVLIDAGGIYVQIPYGTNMDSLAGDLHLGYCDGDNEVTESQALYITL